MASRLSCLKVLKAGKEEINYRVKSFRNSLGRQIYIINSIQLNKTKSSYMRPAMWFVFEMSTLAESHSGGFVQHLQA